MTKHFTAGPKKGPRSVRRNGLGLAALAALSITALSTTGDAQTAGSGYGWDPLEDRVDQKIVDYMKANDIAGMTVAISKDGRLILSKGYGGKSAPNGTDMRHNTRTRLGSTSKPLVTGPTGVELMARRGIDPKTKRLYGPDGVFYEDRIFNDQIYGVNRHSPIVAMAIGPTDKVYTWLRDGTYVSGASFDLQKNHGRKPYRLPEGKTPSDIVDVAIETRNNRSWVTAYFTDGTYSRSRTVDDLSRTVRIPPEFKKAQKVSLPGGRSMLNVVGIAHAKDHGGFYFWYDDKKASKGTVNDADASRSAYSYSLSESTPYRIRGMGIARSGQTYTWLTNNTAQVGHTDNLDAHRAPYTVKTEFGRRNPNPFNWYRAITLQDLLDHTAGFHRSGDIAGAMVMFNKSREDLSYYQAHRYMLRTRPLRWAPGKYAYSNHGFGLWTIIVPRLAGKSYLDAATEDYLMGAVGLGRNDVRPQTRFPDARDATPLRFDGSVYKPYPHKDSTLGLAAGGWTASAEDMLRITNYQAQNYGFEELDAMGWFSEGSLPKMRLEHNGATGGGHSFVTLFGPDYVSANGTDLGGIHIAIAANTSQKSGSDPWSLARDIVFDVPASNVADWYDAWERMGG